MRGVDFAKNSSAPQGLTQSSSKSPIGTPGQPRWMRNPNNALASQAMRLKLSGKISKSRDVSMRKQVGDVEAEVNPPPAPQGVWWKNVGMEEGM